MTPQVSLILCMESCGAPISIVLIPAEAAIAGPIVDPHIPSCLMIKSQIGTGGEALAARTLIRAALEESVMYLQFALNFKTIPAWILGMCDD